MTDSEKLQAIFDYAKRQLDYAIIERETVSAHYYNNDEYYTYDLVHNVQERAREISHFFNTIKQIIEEPDEYLKERARIEELVNMIMDTKGSK